MTNAIKIYSGNFQTIIRQEKQKLKYLGHNIEKDLAELADYAFTLSCDIAPNIAANNHYIAKFLFLQTLEESGYAQKLCNKLTESDADQLHYLFEKLYDDLQKIVSPFDFLDAIANHLNIVYHMLKNLRIHDNNFIIQKVIADFQQKVKTKILQ